MATSRFRLYPTLTFPFNHRATFSISRSSSFSPTNEKIDYSKGVDDGSNDAFVARLNFGERILVSGS